MAKSFRLRSIYGVALLAVVLVANLLTCNGDDNPPASERDAAELSKNATATPSEAENTTISEETTSEAATFNTTEGTANSTSENPIEKYKATIVVGYADTFDQTTFEKLFKSWWLKYFTEKSPRTTTESIASSSAGELVQTTPVARHRRALSEDATAKPIPIVNVNFKVTNVKLSDDGKTATVTFTVEDINGTPLEKDVIEKIVRDEEKDIQTAIKAESLRVDGDLVPILTPSPAPPPGGISGWKIALIVIAICILVAVLIALGIAMTKKRRSEKMFNVNTRAPGDGSQYLGQRPLSHQAFDNAAYNKSSQTVRIGSFDKP